MKLILASQSPRRQELLQLFGQPFVVRVSDIDETMDHTKLPFDEVARVSRCKALAVQREPEDVVIAAGGYNHSTMGEDMELVVKLHEYCVANDMPYAIKKSMLKIDGETGSIEVGKRADFTVLNGNYDVVLTVRGGKIIYQA